MTRSQMVWLLTLLLGLTLCAAIQVASWPLLHTICRSACHTGQPDPLTARTLHSIGISLDAFAVYSIVRDCLLWLVWFGVGGLIILHRPHDRGPVVAAFFLLLFPLNAANAVALPSGWQPVATITSITAGSVLVLYGLLFPDGRFVPRWTRWVALGVVVAQAGMELVPHALADPSRWPEVLQALPSVVPISAILGSQVYRYRRVATWQQRQQMKWAILGLGVALVGLFLLGLGYAVAPGASKRGSLYDVASFTTFPLVTTVIPVSIGIAMLRSRLWDVDRVINRTLVYGSLSLSLLGMYLGSVVLLQALFHAVTGQGSGLAVALSTLAIAALFSPLRRAIQSFIDRRFYRRKVDAARTLAALSARLRNNVDLEGAAAEILAVVQETMQPAHVSLWLR